MRITTSIAATAVAVLALTLTGCGSDGDGTSAAPAKDDKGASQSKATGKPAASGTGASGDMKSSSPTATPSRSKAPSKTAAPVPSRTTSAPAKAPVPSRTTAAPPATPSKLASVQGTWYYPVRDSSGNVITLRISGTSMSANGNKGTCSGTINASMAATFTCGGESTNGTAQVSNGGQTLTFNWSEGNPDVFVRTKPA
ncbi:hypothetical protein [Streptomyces sp. ME19-01-6]|uniref:hypothetical protein n=1 Tax=Streptomyces sp. ME19-01-6 TaxID=3028686 RepID=UPI0029AF7752|nr:hypothetical protein [Streptomyces sp. ME19-01-6]MDX3232614.1 hypothetical protein [Streptomyces sp. ME19-01-6]